MTTGFGNTVAGGAGPLGGSALAGGTGTGGAIPALGSALAAAPGRAAAETAADTAQLSAAGGDEKDAENHIRIIANRKNNALLIYATPGEYAVIEGMLRKVDIIPLQVLIEATIAEVTLNDALQYGTQFYLRENKFIQTLSQGTTSTFAQNFPGFAFTRGAGLAINALSEVSTVKVLSAPQVMVLDNEPARLQVGSLVPVLTGSAQSTLTSGAPIVNNVDYHPIGVIMQVTPHVNSGGLVTLDIGQEVSDVAAQTTQGIDSPTFDERVIKTRVAIQDGQTIGMAGLIQDNTQQGNSGIPFLKDVPVLGLLAGSQNNKRTRTELLVMLTPHVVRDQRDARALTEDLRNQLRNSAVMPQYLNTLPPSGSPNPQGQYLSR
jgi:general secretion pathway protein D